MKAAVSFTPLRRLSVVLVLVTLTLDQLSKYWVLYGLDLPQLRSISLMPGLNFTMVWNKGISMGLVLGDWLGKYGIIILTLAISSYLAHWMWTNKSRLESLSLALILGGALGNLIDRFVHGAVVDFVHLYGFGYDFYVFNLADAAISLGAGILVLSSLRAMIKTPKLEPED